MSQAPGHVLSPPSIAVPLNLWDLGADVAAIRGWAGGIRELAGAAQRSHDLVTGPADELQNRWHGKAASTWNAHRVALYADLRRTSAVAEGIGARLYSAAGILEEGQHRLTALHGRACELSPITVVGPSMVFHPADTDTAAKVLGCVRDAERVRAGLVQALRFMPTVVEEDGSIFDDIDTTWGGDTSIVLTKPGSKGGRRRPPDDEGDWVWHPRPDPPRRTPFDLTP
ncbi:MAG: hypothetical protein M3O55_01235 [Actinomycetota bacterium]|nr:hypothetical protein [Actinomycetota bacterium]